MVAVYQWQSTPMGAIVISHNENVHIAIVITITTLYFADSMDTFINISAV